jgi:hypothetical protein
MAGWFARLFWPPTRAKYLDEKRQARKKQKVASRINRLNQQIVDERESQVARRTIPSTSRQRHSVKIDRDPTMTRKTTDIILMRDGSTLQTFNTRGKVHKAIAHPEGLGIARLVERNKGPEVELLHVDGGVCLKGHAKIGSEIQFNDQGVLYVDGSPVQPLDPQNHTGPGYRGTDDILLSVHKYREEARKIQHANV